ncbi:MAG: histidine phosphatase family protein, partial [Pseudomonadota bacterium]|nr:histidine phosphatase family protein [Pseudomonadota bacterium]
RALRQTAALRATLAGLPAGQRVLLVSHYVNIADFTGQTTASGEILVTRRGGDGTLVVTDRFVIAP